jgi:hypothetical protein
MKIQILKAALSLLVALATIGCAHSQDVKDWRARQEQWWVKGRSIEDAVVVLAALRRSASAELQDDITDSLIGLLVLLDDDDDPATLDALADLGNYYLGAAPGEIYSCLVMRKGQKIVPILRAQMSERTDSCITRFGQDRLLCENIRNPSRGHRQQVLLDSIAKNVPCTLEQ